MHISYLRKEKSYQITKFQFLPGKKIKLVLSDVVSILVSRSIYRQRAFCCCRLKNSFNLAVGNVSNLITKFLNLAIVLRSGWDVKLPLSPSVREELTFWKDNIRLMNGRPIEQCFSTNRTIVYCVASDLVVGGGGGVGFLKDTMVSFTTIPDPLRRQAAVLPGVSCKRSTFVSPAFPDP